MFEQTNVDGIMIGRGAIGNPFIFEQIIDYLQGKEERKIGKQEKLDVILEHINLYLDDGMSEKDAIKTVAKERGVAKSIIYKEYHENKK